MIDNPKSITNAKTKKFFHNKIENSALMTYKEAARYLGISETHVRRIKYKFKTVQIGVRAVRYVRSSLDQWIEENQS